MLTTLRPFRSSKPQKEDSFLKAATNMVQKLGFYGTQKGGITLDSAKENFSSQEIEQLQKINQHLTHAVNKHHPHASTKKPKKSKK